jgi:type VI secretion system protein ImpG
MADEELEHCYQRELAYLRKLGGEFAEAHPKIAARLKLGADASTDPHVERMIEAVAFLNARIRRKLDDDFPELTDALLGFLYPHYLAPVPSMAIVRFECDPALAAPYRLPAGTLVETEPIDGEPVRFRTGYATTLHPIKVAAASLAGPPAPAPPTPQRGRAKGVLRIALESRGDASLHDLFFPKAGPAEPRLRLYLHGQAQHVNELYELLFTETLEVALATGVADPAPKLLGPDALQPVGFGEDEGILPFPPRSHPGYRLLTEFFAFPGKFLFVDVVGLDARKLAEGGKKIELFVTLSRSSPDVEQNVRATTFALGCAPMVNLFARRAEPVRLTQAEHEVRVVPDARRARSLEVWSVDRVTASSSAAQRRDYQPLHGVTHDLGPEARKCFYTLARRPAIGGKEHDDRGTETFLSLVDLDLEPSAPAQWVLDVETTCLNRDLPSRLPFGGGQPKLKLSEAGGPIPRIECMTAPTPTLRPPMREGAAWRLVSHLNLNHLSLEGPDGVEAFREILRLYDVAGREENQSMIRGVTSIRCKEAALRVADGGAPGVARGTEIALHLDETRFSGNNLFLFACVVERFLGLYAAVNSFVRLALTTNRREGAIRRWPARAGDRILL